MHDSECFGFLYVLSMTELCKNTTKLFSNLWCKLRTKVLLGIPPLRVKHKCSFLTISCTYQTNTQLEDCERPPSPEQQQHRDSTEGWCVVSGAPQSECSSLRSSGFVYIDPVPPPLSGMDAYCYSRVHIIYQPIICGVYRHAWMSLNGCATVLPWDLTIAKSLLSEGLSICYGNKTYS